LRLLEEEEVTCIYANKIEPNLYAFNCSKSVKGPVSKIRYVENSLKINGESLPDYDELPLSKSDIANLPDYSVYPLHTLKNSEIIDRTTNSFTIEGENSDGNLASNDAYLYFNENNDQKKISCEIKEESSNKLRVICKPESRVNSDLSNNNYIAIEDKKQSLKMAFNKGANSNPSSSVEINPVRTFKKSSSGGLSAGTIVAIILPLIAVLAIIIALLFLIRYKLNPKPPVQQIYQVPNTSHMNLNYK
jgi:hypothetical protein